jgi:N6-L-threonylcarbamoyladenine synthase
LCNKYEKKLIVPPINLCTDNAAMISWTGVEKMLIGIKTNLEFAPKSKWSIGNY